MGVKFCSLSSGSSGNCQYIETDNIRILIDAGLSGKRIEELLKSIDVCPTTIDCILVTHEHIDHIKGAGILSRRFNIEIFPLSISHDASDPVGYCIQYNDKKLSLVTDIGWVTENVKKRIKNSCFYLIESNHDIEMLKAGRYPWYLKKRIMSEKGHLSNDDAGILLSEVLSGNGEQILLGHLSKENNFPELAYATVKNIVENVGIDVHKDISLELTYRDKATKVYNF